MKISDKPYFDQRVGVFILQLVWLLISSQVEWSFNFKFARISQFSKARSHVTKQNFPIGVIGFGIFFLGVSSALANFAPLKEKKNATFEVWVEGFGRINDSIKYLRKRVSMTVVWVVENWDRGDASLVWLAIRCATPIYWHSDPYLFC